MNIFEDKRKTRNFIILVSIGLIILIAGIFFIEKAITTYRENHQPPVTETDQMLIDMGVPKEDIDKMTEEEKNTTIDEEYYERTAKDYIYTKGKKEYDNTNVTMDLLLSHLGSFKFSSIVSEVEKIKSKYNFTTTENRAIISMYNDAKMLTSVYTLNDIGYSNVLLNATHPAVYTGIYLSAPFELVKEATLSDLGKYPIYNSIVTFSEPEALAGDKLTNDTNYSLFEDYLPLVDTVYKVKVTGTTTTPQYTEIMCYPAKLKSGAYRMLGCFDINTSSLYVTELVN